MTLPLAQYMEQATVTDEAIQAYFDKNKERLVNPEQVHLQWIELTQEKIAEGL